jgi:glycosyltransferase involved in cell wall biosynthesis
VAIEVASAADRCSLGQTVLVHDYLNQRGGAERVVLEMSNLWPDAPIYTSLYRPASTFDEFAERDVRTTSLDRLPVDRHFRTLFPLYPAAFRSLGPIDADVVVSSSSGWSHAVRTSERAYHVVYCHSPSKWLWGDYLGSRAGRLLLRPAASFLRRWDAKAARRPDLYMANSREIQAQIKRAYGLTAEVVYPPVDVGRFTPRARGERLLTVARLLGYKRIELIVEAATKAGIGLDVVGTGPELADLRARAGPGVAFHGSLDDASVTELFESCRAYCLPAREDFGISAVEAQAAGKPVIAFGRGGALETVEDGVSGVFFNRHSVGCVIDAIARCDEIDTPPEHIAALASRFSPERFRQRLTEAISAGLAREPTAALG